MGYIHDRIRMLSGKGPSARAELLLDAWLLPGEPVEAALCGTVRLMSTWFVATPTTLVMLRDGMQPSIDSFMSFDMVVGWQTYQNWASEMKFDLNTCDGIVTLSQVKTRYAVAFGQAIESISGSLGLNGMPTEFQQHDCQLAELIDLLTELLRDEGARGAVSDSPIGALVALDVGRALVRSFGGTEVVSYGHALVLWGLSYIVDLGQNDGLTRSQRVFAFQSTIEEISPDYAMVTAMHAASGDSQADWADLITHFAGLIDAFAAWLSASLSTSLRAGLTKESYSLRALVTPKLQVQGSTSDGPPPRDDDVLGKLERLQELRVAGAVTDEEFAHMKGKIFTAQL